MLVARVFVPFALGYLLSYLIRTINAVAGEPISAELGLSAGELGFLTSAYFAGFAIAQLPGGILIDRYGPRRVEALVFLLAAGGCLIFAVAGGTAHLILGRALMGFGASICLMAPLSAYLRWFPGERLPLVNGLHMAFGAAGGFLAGAPVDGLIHLVGWRQTFAFVAVAIVVVCLAIWLVVPPSGDPRKRTGFAILWRELGTIAADRRFWRLVPLSTAIQGAVLSIGSLWTGPWLRQVAGLTDEVAADWLSIYALAVLVGFIGTGWIAQQANRRGLAEPTFVGLTVVFLAIEALIVALPAAAGVWLWIPYMAVGVFAIHLYAATARFFPLEMVGRVNTLHNFVVFVAAFLVQWLFGVWLDLFPNEAGTGSLRIGFDTGFAILAALQVAGLVPLLLMRRRIDETPAARPAA